MYQAYFRTQEYRQQDVMGASPLRLVVMAYDVAIQACEQKDFERAVKAISVLRDALDFNYQEIAVGLFRIYQFCLDCLRKGDYPPGYGLPQRAARSLGIQRETPEQPAADRSPSGDRENRCLTNDRM